MRIRHITLRSRLLWGAACIVLTNFADGALAQRRGRLKRSPTVAACLPPTVKANDIAVYGFNGKGDVTVAQKVKELQGRCRNGRLATPKMKQIRFFHIQCWGHPPPDYLEIRAEEKRNLDTLKRRYAVIVIGCDPRIP